MNYELIVAMSKNGVIGHNNKLPWNIREDLENFSKLTKGHIVIMGRKTFESLPNGPLKNRLNVILSRMVYNNNNFTENVIFTSMEYLNTIINLHQTPNKKIFIIGGSEIYKIFIEYCDIIHITLIDEIIEGDSFFPVDYKYIKKYYRVKNESEILYSKNENIKYQYITYNRK